MSQRLTPADVTPERIVAIAERFGVSLMPGRRFTFAEGGRLVGCCPVGVLALEADPAVTDDVFRATEVLEGTGLNESYRMGMACGFDGHPDSERCESYQAFHEGLRVGRAVRTLAGLDAGGPPA